MEFNLTVAVAATTAGIKKFMTNTRELYHFHILNEYSSEWQVGKKITINKERINNYHRDILDLKTNNLLNADTEGLIYTLDEFSELGIKLDKIISQVSDINMQNQIYREYLQKFISILPICKRSLRYYVNYIREITFEDVRVSNYPDLPSRRSCLWVCDEDNIETWKRIWTKDKEYKLFKLKLTGKFHQADSRLINDAGWKIETFTEHANAYWSNKPLADQGNIEPEILFEGEAEIISEII